MEKPQDSFIHLLIPSGPQSALSLGEALYQELLYVMCLDDTKRNKTYSLFSKGLKMRLVYSYPVKQYVIHMKWDGGGDANLYLVFTLFHPLLEFPEPSILSCPREGGCGGERSSPQAMYLANAPLDHACHGGKAKPSELLKLSDECLVLTILITHHVRASLVL